MRLKKSCLSCKYNHDMPSRSSSMTWCLLRKIKLSSDFSGYAFCHHWSDKSTEFSRINSNPIISEHQLDFDGELISK